MENKDKSACDYDEQQQINKKTEGIAEFVKQIKNSKVNSTTDYTCQGQKNWSFKNKSEHCILFLLVASFILLPIAAILGLVDFRRILIAFGIWFSFAFTFFCAVNSGHFDSLEEVEAIEKIYNIG